MVNSVNLVNSANSIFRGFRSSAVVVSVAVAMSLLALFAAPVFAQSQGPQTVEPTLAECRGFVRDNGVPAQRPFAEGRGYSGWDVCLSMAYDGDLGGAFDASDTDGDGVLDAGEQATYVESVMGGNPSGPGDAGPVEPLGVETCRALVEENGLPESDPLSTISGGTRPEFELAMCQSLALTGDLDSAFAEADVNDDGALDLPEQTSYQRSVAAPIGEGGEVTQPITVERCDALVAENGLPESDPLHFYMGGSQESYDIAVCQSLAMSGDLAGTFGTSDTSGDGVLQQDEITSYSRDIAAGTGIADGAAQEQYEQTGMEATGMEATGFEETTAITSPETTGATTTTPPEATTGGSTEPQDEGVLSAIGSLLRGELPSTGGIALIGLVAAAVLIVGGGILAYRSRR